MFPQCMTRANNPKGCDCSPSYSYRADPDETAGRRLARAQANAEARRSIGRKVTLQPSPAEAVRDEIETRFWSIVDRDGLTGLPSDMWAALEILVTRAARKPA